MIHIVRCVNIVDFDHEQPHLVVESCNILQRGEFNLSA